MGNTLDKVLWFAKTLWGKMTSTEFLSTVGTSAYMLATADDPTTAVKAAAVNVAAYSAVRGFLKWFGERGPDEVKAGIQSREFWMQGVLQALVAANVGEPLRELIMTGLNLAYLAARTFAKTRAGRKD